MWKQDKPKRKLPVWPPPYPSKNAQSEFPVDLPVSRITPIRELRERKRELLRKAQEDAIKED